MKRIDSHFPRIRRTRWYTLHVRSINNWMDSFSNVHIAFHQTYVDIIVSLRVLPRFSQRSSHLAIHVQDLIA